MLIVVRLMVEARPRYTLIIQQFLTSKSPFLYGGLIVITAKGDPIFISLSPVILTESNGHIVYANSMLAMWVTLQDKAQCIASNTLRR